MSIMAAVQDGMVILDLENDGPIVLISKLSNLDLRPVEPIMMSVLEREDMLQFDVLELTLEVIVAERNDKIEMSLNGGIDLNLLEGIMRVRVVLLLVVVVIVMVAHLNLIIVLHYPYRYLYRTGLENGSAGFIVCIN